MSIEQADKNAEPDGTIVDAVLAGQTQRFEVIVRRYQAPLRRMAVSRLGRDEWAEDVVQETFLCAFKSLHSYDSRFSFRTWLWTILLNQCRRLYQKQQRSPQVRAMSDQPDQQGVLADVLSSLASDRQTPPSQLLAKERSEQLQALLCRLPQTQADALRLRFYGELTFAEIAAAMGCSLSSAKNRVRLGLTKMSHLIQGPPTPMQIGDGDTGPTSGETA